MNEFLSAILGDLLEPLSFKKKGALWVADAGEFSKIVQLQKSSFGNTYYINYGYVFKKLQLGSLKMHIYKGVGSKIKMENEKLKNLLTFDNSIDERYRKGELTAMLQKLLIEELAEMKTKEDIKQMLLVRQNLNDVNRDVRHYLGIY